MQKPSRLFHSLTERIPRRHRAAEVSTPLDETDNESSAWLDELENYQYNQPYYTLAESLDMFSLAETSTGRQQEDVRHIIVADAHDLAARLLSESLVEVMDIKPKHPENTALEHTGEFSLRSIYLLVHAYDITRNKQLANVIGFAFATGAPNLSEQLQRAYEHGRETNQSIMSTYRLLAAIQDEALDMRLVVAGKSETEMAATGAVDAIPQEN